VLSLAELARVVQSSDVSEHVLVLFRCSKSGGLFLADDFVGLGELECGASQRACRIDFDCGRLGLHLLKIFKFA